MQTVLCSCRNFGSFNSFYTYKVTCKVDRKHHSCCTSCINLLQESKFCIRANINMSPSAHSSSYESVSKLKWWHLCAVFFTLQRTFKESCGHHACKVLPRALSWIPFSSPSSSLDNLQLHVSEGNTILCVHGGLLTVERHNYIRRGNFIYIKKKIKIKQFAKGLLVLDFYIDN